MPVIASTRRDFNPQLSPDGSRIAFVSARTGGWEIYLSDADGRNPVQLTSFGNVVLDGIRWSRNGGELTFAVLRGTDRDIYVMPSAGGAPRQIVRAPSDEGRPSFSMDGNWIYFRSNRSGRDEIWKIPHEGGEPIQVTRKGGFEALESLDGKTLYFTQTRASDGLWSMPPSGGQEHPVLGLEQVWQGRWGVTQDGVCYVSHRWQEMDPAPPRRTVVLESVHRRGDAQGDYRQTFLRGPSLVLGVPRRTAFPLEPDRQRGRRPGARGEFSLGVSS